MISDYQKLLEECKQLRQENKIIKEKIIKLQDLMVQLLLISQKVTDSMVDLIDLT